MKNSLNSLFARGISILSKFFLIMFLIKVLPLSEYGTFQLISYFILMSIYIYGLEYYMYSNRDIANKEDIEQKINNHISFFITLFPLTFSIQIVAMYFLLPLENVSFVILFMIFFISFSEYFSQEIYRYLIMLEKVLEANSLLIVKSLLFLVLLIGYFEVTKSLDLFSILIIMSMSYFILILISLYYLFSIFLSFDKINYSIFSLTKLKQIFKILRPFIILMLFMKGLEYFDKFFISYLYGVKLLGIYAFFISIAMLVHIFTISGFYIIYLPKLIQRYEEKNYLFKKEFFKFSLLTILSTLIVSICIVIFINPLLSLLGKEELKNYIDLLYILLISLSFLNLSLIPNLLLYIAGKEEDLMWITGGLLLINIGLNIMFMNYFTINGVAIALGITYLLSIFFKYRKGKEIWIKEIKTF